MTITTPKKYQSSNFQATLPRNKSNIRNISMLLVSAMAFSFTLGLAGEAGAAIVGVNVIKIAETTASPDPQGCQLPSTNIGECFSTLSAANISNDEVAFHATFNQFPNWTTINRSVNGSIGTVAIGYSPGGSQYSYVLSEFSISDGTVALTSVDGASGYSRRKHLFVRSSGVSNTAFNYYCAPIAPEGHPDYCATELGNPSVSDGLVAFNVNSSLPGSAGIFIYDNRQAGSSAQAVVAPEDTLPNGGHLSNFGNPSLSGNLVAFVGVDDLGESAIYTKDIAATGPNSLSVIADLATPIPGGSGNFNGFGTPSLRGNRVAFLGKDSQALSGIYTGYLGANYALVANTNTTIPGSATKFASFSDPVVSDTWVGFLGADVNNKKGIYTNPTDGKANAMLKIVTVGDVLDGKVVTDLIFGREGLSGNSLAFVATFADGSSTIYRADIATKNNQCKHRRHKKLRFRH